VCRCIGQQKRFRSRALAERYCEKATLLALGAEFEAAQPKAIRLRDELLNEILIRSLPHARVALDTWRWDYNRASEHPSVYVIEEKRLC
jgi:hypothetical protein